MRILCLPALGALGLLAIAAPQKAHAAVSIRPAVVAVDPGPSVAVQPVDYYWHHARWPYRWHGGYYRHRRWWHGYWRYY